MRDTCATTPHRKIHIRTMRMRASMRARVNVHVHMCRLRCMCAPIEEYYIVVHHFHSPKSPHPYSAQKQLTPAYRPSFLPLPLFIFFVLPSHVRALLVVLLDKWLLFVLPATALRSERRIERARARVHVGCRLPATASAILFFRVRVVPGRVYKYIWLADVDR